eukprot:1159840-Pelagomonas_calceolata.AAC.2
MWHEAEVIAGGHRKRSSHGIADEPRLNISAASIEAQCKGALISKALVGVAIAGFTCRAGLHRIRCTSVMCCDDALLTCLSPEEHGQHQKKDKTATRRQEGVLSPRTCQISEGEGSGGGRALEGG